MASSINVQPQTVDLALYAGDGVSLKFTCKDSNGDVVDITGTVKSQIRVDRSPGGAAVVSFTVSLTEHEAGIIKLSLTGAQTQTLVEDASAVSGRFTGVWDVEWTPTGLQPYTICQGKVECIADVSR